MLYYAEGFVTKPKSIKTTRFKIRIVRDSPGLSIESFTQDGYRRHTCTSYQFCRDMAEARYYLKSHLVGRRNRANRKIIVNRQTRGQAWL